MTATIEAWVIYADSPGTAPRDTDDLTFAWGWREAIAILPGDATPAERAAALAVAAQTTHYVDGERDDVLQFSDRNSYLFSQASDEHFSALHPYLEIAPARNVRYEEATAGEHRGRILFDVIPAAELA